MSPIAIFVKIFLKIFSDDRNSTLRHRLYIDSYFIIYHNIR